jgi:pyridoxamine 5'-phosphate oxidase-like protein
MPDPLVGRPEMPGYGVPDEVEGALPWSWAEERLVACRNYFVASVKPDGRPHVMPVWGAWVHGMFVFSTAITSVKSKNLLANPGCVVTVDDGHEAVIVEGEAKIVEKDEIPDFFDEYLRKYEYKIADDSKWAVVPRRAFGFIEDDSFAKTATKWRWER